MIEVTVVACIAVVVLAAIVVVQARASAAERRDWQEERRYLTDRVIAKHIGEVLQIEREHTDRVVAPALADAEKRDRILIEGLS